MGSRPNAQKTAYKLRHPIDQLAALVNLEVAIMPDDRNSHDRTRRSHRTVSPAWLRLSARAVRPANESGKACQQFPAAELQNEKRPRQSLAEAV